MLCARCLKRLEDMEYGVAHADGTTSYYCSSRCYDRMYPVSLLERIRAFVNPRGRGA